MRMITRILALSALAAALAVAGMSGEARAAQNSAQAGGPGKTPVACGPYDLKCWEQQKLPGDSGATGSATSTGKRVCRSNGKAIDCTSADGSWDDQRGCYVKLADQQASPPAGQTTGAWYACTWPAGAVSGFTGYTVWLNQPPAVDPAQLARELLASIQLTRIVIGTTPEQGKSGLLGLPTYLWVQNPGPRTLGPISDSATEGNVTVALTGKVGRVVWDMGDGTTVTCAGAGTPYQDSFGAAPSPTCGHMYKQPSTGLPGGTYRVTATAVWDIAWTGGGQSGVIPFKVTSTGSLRIGEAQALN